MAGHDSDRTNTAGVRRLPADVRGVEPPVERLIISDDLAAHPSSESLLSLGADNARGEEERAALAPPPSPAAGLDWGELGDEYGDTKVALIVRDPEWVFAYWEIAPQDRARLQMPRGRHRRVMILRWYDVTGVAAFTGENARRIVDTEIDDEASSWYQKLPDPGGAWCAELGVIGDDDRFLPLCRSSTVHTPRSSMVPASDSEVWMDVGTPRRRLVERDDQPGPAVEQREPAGVEPLGTEGLPTHTEPARVGASEQILRAAPEPPPRAR